MDIRELETMALWFEAALSALTVLLFLFASWQIYYLAKQYSIRKANQRTASNRKSLQLKAKSNRKNHKHADQFWENSPRALRLVRRKSLIGQLRSVRIRQFQKISLSLIQEVNDFFQNADPRAYEARTMLPLIAEARALGERLLSERKKVHKLLNGKGERQIEYTIHDLLAVETRLRSIPRAAYTLEEVVAGKFEHIVSK